MAIGLKPGKHTSARVKSRLRRQVRTRKMVQGTPGSPRLVITRSSRHMVAKVVDDLAEPVARGRSIHSAHRSDTEPLPRHAPAHDRPPMTEPVALPGKVPE